MTSKRQGHFAVGRCEIPYLTVLAAVIRPVEGYEVTRPQDIRLLQAWSH